MSDELSESRSHNGRLSQALRRLGSEKKRRFVLEWSLDYDLTRAFKEVYKANNVKTRINQLLQDPNIQRCMDIVRDRDVAEFQIEKKHVLYKLYQLLMCDRREFYREDGTLKSPQELSAAAAALLNGFKQREYRDEEGNVTHVDTSVQLAKIEKIVEMCMKHKGLFAPEQHEHKVTVDFSNLPAADNHDPVQERIDAEYQRLPEEE